MMFSKLLDKVSEYLAHRKGLLPLLGILLIVINLMLQFILPPGWLVSSNLFLHIGLIVAILGFLLARAL
jgi:membrane-bound ClpP family serine protease